MFNRIVRIIEGNDPVYIVAQNLDTSLFLY